MRTLISYHMRVLLCCLLFTCVDVHSSYSQSFDRQLSFVVMKRYRMPIAQSYRIDPNVSIDSIRKQWNMGYHIGNLSRGDYGVAVVMNGGMIPQTIISSDSIPWQSIRDQLALGMRITSMAGHKGKWDIVLSLDNGVQVQHFSVHSAFPKETIQEYWNKGYRIGVLDMVNGKWILTMNRYMFGQSQSYKIADTFPKDHMHEFMRGYALRNCKNIGNAFLFIAEGNAEREEILYLQGQSLTRQAIDSAWEQGYSIIEMQMDDSQMEYMNSTTDNFMEIESFDLSAMPLDSAEHSMFDAHIQATKEFTSSAIAMRRRAQGYLLKKDTASAIMIYERYRISIPFHREWIDSSLALLTNPIEPLEIVNLGAPINTPGSEWDPVPTPDGRSLFLSVRDRVGGEGRQDVFVCERSDSAKDAWSKPVSVGVGVNSSQGEETIDNVSTDGNTIFLSGTFPGSYGRFDIYTADRTQNGWDNLRQLPRPINSEFHDESGCLSSDGRVLLFSSDRPGAIGEITVPMSSRWADATHGNMDLWASIKTDTGWTEPINLGKNVNTPFSERSLFLHPDGRTLYFSSNGHPGLGGLDVYKTYRLNEDSWTEWSIPQNLGRAINTTDDDFSYKITVSGDTAYYAAQDAPGGMGQWDVYRVILPKNVRPQPTASISGTVIDKKTGKPISATIVWEDLQTGKKVGSSTVHPQEGTFFIVLPLGKKYGYYAGAEGYFPSSSNIDLRKQTKSLKKQHVISMTAMPVMPEEEMTVELSNVFFEYGSSTLLLDSRPELQRLATIINEKQYKSIEIAGHTDDKGSDAFNDRLSLRRAESVKTSLIELGIPSSILKTRGFGKKKPRFTDGTEEGRAGNRRVEITISGK